MNFKSQDNMRRHLKGKRCKFTLESYGVESREVKVEGQTAPSYACGTPGCRHPDKLYKKKESLLKHWSEAHAPRYVACYSVVQWFEIKLQPSET